MTLANFSFFGFGKPKPINTRGTRMAIVAAQRALKKNGVNPQLKNALKQSLRNRKPAAKMLPAVVAN